VTKQRRKKSSAKKNHASSAQRKKALRGAASQALARFDEVKKTEFLSVFARGGTVADAALEVGIEPVIVHMARRSDEVFAQAFEEARDLNVDTVEDRLLHMAQYGNQPVALFGILKARRPETWREKAQIDHTNSDGSLAAFKKGMVDGASRLEESIRKTH